MNPLAEKTCFSQVLFHVDPARVREIYLSLGPEYRKVIIEPELSSAVRGLTSEEDAKVRKTPSWPRSWANFSLL